MISRRLAFLRIASSSPGANSHPFRTAKRTARTALRHADLAALAPWPCNDMIVRRDGTELRIGQRIT